MLKHYCFFQFRKWWPMILIMGLVIGMSMTFTALNLPVNAPIDNQESSLKTMWIVYGLVFLFLSYFASFAVPLTGFAYRTRRQSVDAIYQAPYKRTTIKRVHIVVGLIILAIAMTAAFFMSFSVYVLRYIATPQATQMNTYYANEIYYRLDVNFGGFFLIYLFVLLFVSAQYLINCFLVSLGNYVFDQICLLIFGNAFLLLCIMGPATYFMALVARSGGSANIWVDLLGFGITGPTALLICFISGYAETSTLAASIVSTGMMVCASVACALADFFMPDPSGEYANTKEQFHPVITYIPHWVATTIGFFVCVAALGLGVASSVSVLAVSLPFFLFSIYDVGYFAILALWRHTFRLKKVDLITFFINSGVMLFLTFFSLLF